MHLQPLKVAWISYFGVEWLPDLPPALRSLPRQHPATWQRVLLEELRPRPDLEIHVLVVRKHFPRHSSFQWNSVNFHCLKVPGGLRTLSLFWWETFVIRRCLRRIRPDLVHAWGSERAAALVASRLPHPFLVTMQGLLQWYAQRVNLGLYQGLEARLEHLALRRASVVTTESNFAVDWLGHHYPHLEIVQAEHAPNWLFHRIERRPRTPQIQFIYVGALNQIKGSDLLLAALDRLKDELDFRLTIVGSAEPGFLEHLRSATTPRTWERITFKVNLTPAQVAEELAGATIMLFPTRVDTSPNSVKEAVVAGLPVVASHIGGIPDYVHSGKNGVTFPAGDPGGFVSAIRQAVSDRCFGQGRVDAATLAEMRSYLSPARMAERFLHAYHRVAPRLPR